MKRNIIIIITVAVACVAALASCQKEAAPIETPSGIHEISASIEQPSDEGSTKTYLGTFESGNGYPINWSEKDAIAVSGQVDSEFKQYTLIGGKDTKNGTFRSSSDDLTGTVYAYYPYSAVTGVDAGIYTVNIPDTLSYTESTFANGAMPMYAIANDIASGLTFSPLMSVLKLQLKGTCTVKSIVVTSDTENLSGTATVNMSEGTISFTSGNKKVTLDCGSGVALNETSATVFHIVVPAASSKNYTITIKDTYGRPMTKNITDRTFTAGNIKKMAELTVAAPVYTEGSYSGDGIYVGGNWWAPVNCGYDATNYPMGSLYQWGRMYGQPYELGNIAVTTNMSKSDDTEENQGKFGYNSTNKNWFDSIDNTLWSEGAKGAKDPCPNGWRVPTKSELDSLIAAGKSYTSTGGPSSNQKGLLFGTSPFRVFLPIAGWRSSINGNVDMRGSRGGYRTSSVSGDQAVYMYIDNEYALTKGDHRSYGFSVRCVLE